MHIANLPTFATTPLVVNITRFLESSNPLDKDRPFPDSFY